MGVYTARSVRSLLISSLLLVGCSESPPGDVVVDDDDSVEVDPLCEEPGEPDQIPWDPQCRVEFELPDEPALEVLWQVDSFADEPAYDQVMMTPLVLPLVDGDGDGGEAPHVLPAFGPPRSPGANQRDEMPICLAAAAVFSDLLLRFGVGPHGKI